LASTVEAAILEAAGISAVHNRKTILRDVNFTLRPGEIHALVGSHHSGKTALGNLFMGTLAHTAGTLRVDGREFVRMKPSVASGLGISMLRQNSLLIPNLNVAENVFLGALPRFLSGRESIFPETERLLARVGASVAPGDRVASLPQAKRNLIELAALLANRPRAVILDEASRRFNSEEMERIYEIMGGIRGERGGIIFISASIDEIYEFADRVTILRDGRCCGTENVHRADKADLINRTYSFAVSRESLRRSNIELHNYKKYNERILQNLPIGIVILDPGLRIHFLNQTALSIVSPDDPHAILKVGADLPPPIASMLSTPELIDELLKVRLGDRLIQATTFPFDDTDGEALGMILLLEDVTGETRMKDYLMRAERLKSTAALASSLAHEINNPLCIMRNYLELILRSRVAEEPREYLEKIGGELDRIVSVVNNLLPFSRQQELASRPVCLNRVVTETVELMRIGIGGRNIALDAKTPAEELVAQGSENHLKQVLVNLIANAIEAGDESAGIAVAVTLESGANSARVIVSDNGPGVPDDIAGKIFDPFFSSKSNKSNTGLGLSICHHIVESHGGQLGFQRRNEVTEFSFALPLERQDRPGERCGGR
jgi:signal transduction histidine kinase/ABC-type branched-subunit amino acid transport system ATPase component